MNSSSQAFVQLPSTNLRAQDDRNQRQYQSSGSLIQSNSIQNQFTVLSNQRDKFVSERDEAQKELKQVQTEHQYIKTEHDSLVELNRQAKEKFGERMEKLAMLKEQETRIKQLTENEFRAIHDCTNHTKMVSIIVD